MAYSITIFGDSISFGAGDGKNGGWSGRLKRYFESKGGNHRIYNLSISGNSSREILERFDVEIKARIKFKHEIDRHIIIFAFGINDSFIDLKDNIPNIDVDDFRNNIETLITKSQSYTKEIVFISSIPVDEKLSLNWENLKFTNDRAKQYNNIIKKLCEANNLLFFDIFQEFSKLDYKSLLYDGLHPTPEGHEKMYEFIKGFLIENKIID